MTVSPPLPNSANWNAESNAQLSLRNATCTRAAQACEKNDMNFSGCSTTVFSLAGRIILKLNEFAVRYYNCITFPQGFSWEKGDMDNTQGQKQTKLF